MIASYVDLLNGQLLGLGLNRHQREIVLGDIQARLESLAYHWSDVSFRRTVLVLGYEQAAFWQPRDAPLEIRSLVVNAVRNSALTDLNAQRAYNPGLRSKSSALSDERMPWITSAAIEHFRKADFSVPITKPSTDVFGSLHERYPNAWHVLSVLGNSESQLAPCSLPRPSVRPLSVSSGKFQMDHQSVVESGYSPEYDAALRRILRLIERGELPFFFTLSFKHITRNPEKLFAVIDHIVSHGASLLTPNYLLSPTVVARREPLLRAAHFAREEREQVANPVGLVDVHREALEAMEL